MELKDVSTKDLVGELEKREGVNSMWISPHTKQTFKFDGPAIILNVID